MNTTTLASSKHLNGKTLGIAGSAAAVIVLAIIGWTAGWFGGAEKPAAPAAAVTSEQPAAPAAGTAATTGATQQQGTATTP